ncbi:triose-phosphate isomerase [Sphingomonas sp.]|uniref:triose-phosphate isomerase n=1 Tax=Sphingomonas sp. TaxID=28214 RepID=UPI002ED79D99
MLGHSECRRDARLSHADIACKAAAAVPLLQVMVCVGEAWRGASQNEIAKQLRASLRDDLDPARLSVAYEPVWAIGTGDTPLPAEIDAMHRRLRDVLTARFGGAGEQVRILYGGSVSAGNAREIIALSHVDGLLVGGASLAATTFLPIAEAMAEAAIA